MKSLIAAALASLCLTAALHAQQELLPGNADHRDDCWILRSYPGQTRTTYGIQGTGAELQGDVIWNSFPYGPGTYTVELGAVLESDGDSPYALYIGGQQVRTGNYPYASGSLDCDGSEYVESWIDLGNWNINTGDEIKFWAMSAYPCGSSHGQYARFFAIRFTPTDEPADQIPGSGGDGDCMAFVETDGYVVVECEATTSPLGNWKKITRDMITASSENWEKGFAGDACLQFDANSESGGSPNSILKYTIKITNPGMYQLYMRAQERQFESTRGDVGNDCYVAMIGQNGESGCEGRLTKWVHLGDAWQWDWGMKLECGHHNFYHAVYELDAGIHEFQIAGRSKYFTIDRFHLVKQNHPWVIPTNATMLPSATGDCAVGVTRDGMSRQSPASGRKANGRPFAPAGNVFGLDGRRAGFVDGAGRLRTSTGCAPGAVVVVDHAGRRRLTTLRLSR